MVERKEMNGRCGKAQKGMEEMVDGKVRKKSEVVDMRQKEDGMDK